MSLFIELKRRNVFKVGIAYTITAWLLIQVADILLETIGAPPWIMQTVFVLLALGLVIALFFAWAFELTPEGVKREADVDRSQSITPQTGQKLNRTIIAILILALGYFVVDKFYLSTQGGNTQQPVTGESVETSEETEKAPQTIAVLPFVDMSADGNNEYFSDGLTEELLNILAKIRELRVAGRTSSFAFKGKNEDLRSIGEKLNVSSILEGSVRKDSNSNRVRITAQLINVDDGYHLWSETYDRDLTDIFAIQEEIASKVTEALRVTLLGEELTPIAIQSVTDVSAYDLYLRGLQQMNIHTFAAIKEAIDLFNQVIAKDPRYTPAQLAVAKAWNDLAFTGATSRAEAVRNIEPLLEAILEEDPANAAAHVQMARVSWARDDDESQEKHLELALSSDPRNLEALREMGRYLYQKGNRVDKGREYIEEAERIDPYSVDVLWDLIAFHAFMIQPKNVEPYAERIAKIQPENPNRYWGPAMAYQLSGQLAISLGYQIKAEKLDPHDHEQAAGIASAWLSLGDPEQAETWAKKADTIGADQPLPLTTRVLFYLYREQYGLAADMAKRALDRKMDNRMGSNNVLRRAYISDLVRQGEISQAIEFYQGFLPGAFEATLATDLTGPRQVGPLIDIAILMRIQDPSSDRATELVTLAEQKIMAWDERFLPWVRNIHLAALSEVKNDRQVALDYLDRAYEAGMRMRWQAFLFSNIAFNSLRGEQQFKNLVTRLEEDMVRQRDIAYQMPGIVR